MALEREDAVAHMRTVIGATDPAEAAPGTIRKLFAESKGKNAIHASDSNENAAREVAFFFTEGELARLWGEGESVSGTSTRVSGEREKNSVSGGKEKRKR
jgi:hypothetical protein